VFWGRSLASNFPENRISFWKRPASQGGRGGGGFWLLEVTVQPGE